jgi:hypothetical protein
VAERTITLRSYRLAFEMERRIFRLDRFRIPVPYGLPLRGLAYWLVLVAAVGLLDGLPLTGSVLGALPWPLRFVLLPGAGAYLLCQPRPDGRLAHEAIAAHVVYRCSPRRLVAFAPAPPTAAPHWLPMAVVADERGASYARGVIQGPATVVLRQPARVKLLRAKAHVRQLEDRPLFRPRTVELEAGQRVVFV